ncbi:hypothetical protein [Nonomuraea recticatena]|uniref:hypothetical protein n=1 Tax=Nonomuraea recticatena TaxID=46178 RepID=UPI0036219DD1
MDFEGGVAMAFAGPDTIVLTGRDARAVWDGGEVDIDGCLTLVGPRRRRRGGARGGRHAMA